MRLGFAVVTTIVVVGLVAAGLLSSEEEATALDGETVRSQALEALESKPAFKVVSRPVGAASGRSQETVTEWWSAEEDIYRLDQEGPSGRQSMIISDSQFVMKSGDTGFATVREINPASKRDLQMGPFARYHQMVKQGMPVTAGIRSSGNKGETVYLNMGKEEKGNGKKNGLTAFLVRDSKLPSQIRFVDSENRASAFDMQVVSVTEQELAAAVQEVKVVQNSAANTDKEDILSEREARDFQQYGIYWLGRAAAGYPLRDIRRWKFSAGDEPDQDVVSFSYDRPGERLENDPLRVDSRSLDSDVGEMEFSRVKGEGDQIECLAGDAYVLFGLEGGASAVVRSEDAYVQITMEGPIKEQRFRTLIKHLTRFNRVVDG